MQARIFIFIFLLTTIALAQDCSNPLLRTFGFIGFSTPTTVNGLKYCKSLQSGRSCCSTSIINEFQLKTDQLQSRLRKAVTARDNALASTRTKFIADFRDVAVRFSEAADKAIPKLIEQGSTSIGYIRQLLVVTNTVRDRLETLRAKIHYYQSARTSCVVQMIKIQAAAWCLACDPDYASKGVLPGPTVWVSDSLCSRIANSCYDYMSEGVEQSVVLQFRALLTLFQRLTSDLYKIAEGRTGIQMRFDPPDMPFSEILKPNVMPTNCNSRGDCQWACENLFKNGDIDETLLGFGGTPFGYVISTSSANRRLEEVAYEHRSLTDEIAWNPDVDEAGVHVYFDDNPANIFGERLRTGLCLFIVAIFMFFAY